MVRFSFLILFLNAGLISAISSADERTLNARGEYALASYVWYLEEPENKITIEELLANKKARNWIRNQKPEVNLGFSEATYWFKARVKNHNHDVQEWLLELAYPLLDEVDLYLVDGKGKVVETFNTGDKYNAIQRPIPHPDFIFPLDLSVDEPYTLYLRVSNSGSQQIPLRIWQWSEFSFHSLWNFVLQGLFFGMVTIMALYNFMLWVSERQRIYIVYVGYIVFLCIFLIAMNGLGFLLIWPQWSGLNNYIVPISLALLVTFLSYFLKDFFVLKKASFQLNRFFNLSIYFHLSLAFLSLIIPYHISLTTLIASAFVALSVAIYTTFRMYQMDHPSARYFIMAWTFFLLGGVMLASNKVGLLPINVVTEHGLQFGASLEVMLLSLALADRMASSQKEKLRIQHDRFNLIRRLHKEKEKAYDAEKDKLSLEKQYSSNLEAEVVARTEELQTTLQELESANEKLKNISITDALTGLNNRRSFDEFWQREYKRAHRDNTCLSLIILDIDFFKKVNDQYGHPAGDLCLQEVAKCLLAHASREQDFIARYGGEEFAIILPSTKRDGAMAVAENIRKHVECLEISWESQPIRLTISAGLCSQTPHDTDYLSRDAMLQRADQALYQAKRNGRNREVHYEDISA